VSLQLREMSYPVVAEAVGALYAAEFFTDLGTRKIIVASGQCSELHGGGIKAD
jgi:hypothetical protein